MYKDQDAGLTAWHRAGAALHFTSSAAPHPERLPCGRMDFWKGWQHRRVMEGKLGAAVWKQQALGGAMWRVLEDSHLLLSAAILHTMTATVEQAGKGMC